MATSMNRADRVLAGVFVAFAASWLIKVHYPDDVTAKLMFAVLEAALVGGIADWFAVSALFKKPFGFPWHTALIPRNRAQLIAATAQMVQHDFLSKQKLMDKLDQLPLLDYLIDWVENGKGKYVLLLFLRNLIRKFLAELDAKKAAEQLERFLKTQAATFKIASVVQEWARDLVARDEHQQVLDMLLERLLEVLARPTAKQAIVGYCVQQYQRGKNQDNILTKLFKSAMEWAGQIDPEAFGGELYERALALARAVQADKQHQLRGWIKEKLIDVTATLEKDRVACATLEKWKNSLVQEAHFQAVLEDTVHLLFATVNDSEKQFDRVAGESSQEKPAGSVITTWVMNQLVAYWEILKGNEAVCRQLDRSLKDMVRHLIDREHFIIGEVVTLAMNKLTDEDLNRLIEARIGEELQGIRINGSLVGGLIGLALFLYTQFIGVYPAF